MTLYGCHNKPRPVTGAPIVVRDGYYASTLYLNDVIACTTNVPYVMSTDCQYTKQHAADPHCSGCVHRSKEKA